MRAAALVVILAVFTSRGGAQLVYAQSSTSSPPLVPLPASIVPATGAWTPRGALPADLPLATDAALAAAGIRVRLVPGDSTHGAESYRLEITPRGVDLSAPRDAGRFYGLVTLQQLVDAARERDARAVRVDAMTIADAPRFPWRGLHLDVGRHFQSVTFIKRYIDLMARFKLNTFHWHLTEDQGWRLEIKRYPRLTAVGGCRAETILEKHFDPYVGDGIPHCGWYTQEQVRDVVAYAAARQVTVVPEIEMPGHTVAALAAYPELACTDGPFTVRTIWGVDENILCPSERTFAFLEDVLTEVMALFPSRYIHIGGDEAPKRRWKESPAAQDVMRREGLNDELELQGWFIRRIDTFLARHGRRLVGWDEILEGGLAPGATVMSWRGIAGGIEAAQQGRDVVMTPTSHLYFDYYQGDPRFEPLAIGGLLGLERVYAYEPLPEVLTAEQATHILGAQGNVWTEYLKTPAAVEYMAFPRALALAEVTWSPRDSRSWEGFSARLPFAMRVLDRAGVNYRLPSVSGLERDVLTLDSTTTVTLSVPLAGATIHYTLDGSDPSLASSRYSGPLTVTATEAGVRLSARAFTADGKASPPRAATFRRTRFREADSIDVASLRPGLSYAYAEARIRTAFAADTLPVVRAGIVPSIARRGDERPELYALRFSGYLRVPEAAMYEFALTSDDGSVLQVGGSTVVDNDGFHGSDERTGMIALHAGAHPIAVRFFQGEGGASLDLRVRRAGGTWSAIPPHWLVHRP